MRENTDFWSHKVQNYGTTIMPRYDDHYKLIMARKEQKVTCKARDYFCNIKF